MKKIVVNYGKAPNLMNIDKDLANNEWDIIVLNWDLMKVIPVLVLRNKNSNFSQKLTVYKQTFCKLGSDNKSFCLIADEQR
jgi:hypothetical protein